MIIGLVVAELFTFVIRRNWVIRLPDERAGVGITLFLSADPGFLILSIFGIISWALASYGSNFLQIIMDSISTPLSGDGRVVGWSATLSLTSLLWFFGVHGSPGAYRPG
ncbi:PTS transporter subunit EIIC [Klebsiella pneumoniae subsp. pneumoniae]|nr:PTS transporter subunit EIIC [Klebsiella pneumoniae subsp. pneumoniae]